MTSSIPRDTRTRHRTAFLALCATWIAFFVPHLARGEVIFPHDNSLEVGLRPSADGAETDGDGERESRSTAADDRYPTNRKFSDESSVYVPEMHHHLHGDRSGWISTWNPHVEMGRPTIQLSGFGPAHPLTRVLTWLCDDATWLYTWLVVATLALTAVFGYLFLAELGLDPWACFAGAAFLSLGVPSVYWATSATVLSGVCWTLAILWLVCRVVDRPTWLAVLGLAFATYSLFMSAYPQQIVWHAYLVAPFAIARVWTRTSGGRARAARLAMLAACAALGCLASAPAYLDLAVQSSRSARGTVDPEFLALRDLPATWREMARFFAQIYDAFWVGDPMREDYAGSFAYLSLTPLYASLVLLACIGPGRRRVLPWISFLAVACVLTLWPRALRFGIEHLGLSFSRFAPLRAAPIAWAVIAAFAVDQVVARVGRRARETVPAVLAVFAAWGLAFAGQALGDVRLAGQETIASAVIAIGACAFVATQKPVWLAACTIATVFRYGEPLLLARPRDTIHFESPLVSAVREATRGGATRYAFVGTRAADLLPPTQECRLGLASIHTYNSLSSVAYQKWVLRFSVRGAQAYGRWFRRITSGDKLREREVAWAGIGLFLTGGDLRLPWLALVGEVDGVKLYRPRSEPELFVHNLEAPGSFEGARSPVRCTERHDDRLRFEIQPNDRSSSLSVSMQHHPQWRATSGARELETFVVDDFYLGVRVPPQTESVLLEFRPYVRWAWIPEVAFAIGALACTGAALRSRAWKDRGAREATP